MARGCRGCCGKLCYATRAPSRARPGGCCIGVCVGSLRGVLRGFLRSAPEEHPDAASCDDPQPARSLWVMKGMQAPAAGDPVAQWPRLPHAAATEAATNGQSHDFAGARIATWDHQKQDPSVPRIAAGPRLCRKRGTKAGPSPAAAGRARGPPWMQRSLDGLRRAEECHRRSCTRLTCR
jgi:hypothetical protein